MLKSDRSLLERVAKSPVSFTHGPDMKGKCTRLMRSTISPSQQKHLHRLAVEGYVSEAVTGHPHATPPESTVTYVLTALGRDALGLHAPAAAQVHRHLPLTEAQLLAEGILE